MEEEGFSEDRKEGMRGGGKGKERVGETEKEDREIDKSLMSVMRGCGTQ